MITRLSDIERILAKAVKPLIIGALLLALAGCSALRLGYNNGPQLVWWYLDGYVDFSREQAPAAKQALERLFEWHRATQLPDYAALLSSAQLAVVENTTPAATCRWFARVRDLLEPTVDRALVQSADLLPGVGEAQFKHLAGRYSKSLDEMRAKYLQADPAERLAESVQRALERAEQLYGTMDEPQRRVIAASVAASPFDPQAWMAERQRRQRDVLQTLRRLVTERADADQRVAALRTLAERAERSPDPAYRAYQQKLTDYNCAFAAQLHNVTNAAQRQKARQRLKGWEEDVRSLAPAAPG
jgi:hypothetical protein